MRRRFEAQLLPVPLAVHEYTVTNRDTSCPSCSTESQLQVELAQITTTMNLEYAFKLCV
jgi:hypothetical protein